MEEAKQALKFSIISVTISHLQTLLRRWDILGLMKNDQLLKGSDIMDSDMWLMLFQGTHSPHRQKSK